MRVTGSRQTEEREVLTAARADAATVATVASSRAEV